jgi:hypothetical protein
VGAQAASLARAAGKKVADPPCVVGAQRRPRQQVEGPSGQDEGNATGHCVKSDVFPIVVRRGATDGSGKPAGAQLQEDATLEFDARERVPAARGVQE